MGKTKPAPSMPFGPHHAIPYGRSGSKEDKWKEALAATQAMPESVRQRFAQFGVELGELGEAEQIPPEVMLTALGVLAAGFVLSHCNPRAEHEINRRIWFLTVVTHVAVALWRSQAGVTGEADVHNA